MEPLRRQGLSTAHLGVERVRGGGRGGSRRVFVDLRQYSRTNLYICCAFCGLLLRPFCCFEVYVGLQNVLSNPVLNVLEG